MREIEPTLFHILLHHNADPDAICAAAVYRYFFRSINQQHDAYLYSDDINTTATRIMETFDIQVLQGLPVLDPDRKNVILTVDTANLSQLGKFAEWVDQQDLDLLVVDHHETSELGDIAVASIVITDTASTCVIADRTLQYAGITPTSEIATLIMSGHLYDSRRLLYGSTTEVFHRFGDLIALGGNYDLANEMLQTDMDYGEIIARLKASQRLYYSKIDDVIVVTSRIGAFEASVARSFIGLGADITFVLAAKSNEIRGSARADARLINIGEVMSQLAEEFGGTGGGHAAAAGLNISPPLPKKQQNALLRRFVEIVDETLKQTKPQEQEAESN